MSVRQCQEAVDSEEFTEWLAYDRIDPIGEKRSDVRAAMVALTVARAAAGKKGRRLKLEHFMLDYDARGKVKHMSARAMYNLARAFTQQHGKIVDGDGRDITDQRQG